MPNVESAVAFSVQIQLITVSKNRNDKSRSYFLAMGYKKDIFGSFAYDFELSRCAKVPIITVISYH